jgi:hypothetical protein
MANITWTGNAQSIAQVDTITISSSVAGSELIAVTINGKTFSYTTVSGDTIDTIAANLAIVLSSAQAPEFQEILWSNTASTAVVTCIALTPGVPFTLAVLVTGGTVAATDATIVASAGPYDASSLPNYSTGALPSASDNFTWATGNILYGLGSLSALTLTTVNLICNSGNLGLPDQNPNGYAEYRSTSLVFGGASAVNVGTGIVAPNFCRFKVNGSSTCKVKVDTGAGVAANVAAPSTLITSGGTESLTISVITGAVGLALDVGESITVANLYVGVFAPPGSVAASDEAAAAVWGAGATITASTLNAGQVLAAASTALTMEGGTATVQNGSNIGAVTVRGGGQFIFNSTGTIGVVAISGKGSVFDLTGDPRAVTSITSLSCTGGGYFLDPEKRLGNVAVVTDRISALLCDWGSTMTLTRS